MAFPDGDGIRTRIGLLCQDTNSTNQGLSNTNRDDLFNEVYRVFKEKMDAGVSRVGGTTTGWTALSNGTASALATPTNWTRILRVFNELSNTSNVAIGAQLERMSVSQILGLQQSDTTLAGPKRYAVERDQGALKWRLYLHPMLDSAESYNFSAHVRITPAAMAGGATLPDATVGEVDVFCRIASARGAGLLGRSQEFIGNIWRGVPDDYRVILGREELSAWKRANDRIAA